MHLTESIDMKDGRASHNLTFLKDLSKPTCAQHKKEEVRRSFLDQMLVTHFWYLTLIFKWMKTCTCLCAKRQTFIFFCDLIFQDLDRLLIQFPLSCFRDFFLFAINAYKNSFRQPFHVLYYAREESPAPIACLATILSHLLQLSHSTLCVANILI